MKEMQADIIMIACGISGLAATVAAAEKGARVIVFEKSASAGGAGSMGTGLFAVESRHQRERQMKLTRESAFRMFMDFTHWRGDARLIKSYIDKSADTIHWLEGMGVEFYEPAAYFPGSEFTWHLIKPKGGFRSGEATAGIMVKIMTQRAKELGAQIFFKTAATRILKQNGQITGVMVEDESGKEIKATANAVIIATGGFGDNPKMIKKFTGYQYGSDLFSFRIPGMAGDGLRMAWEVGAARSEISMELTFGIPREDIYGFGVRSAFRQPHLMVNLLGERFVNEEVVVNTPFTGNAISRQKDRCAVMILDQAILDHYEKDGLDLPMSLVFNVPLGNLREGIEKAIAAGVKDLIIADSIGELADKTDIPSDKLGETIEEYNRYCIEGYDGLFNKNRKYLRPVKGPRYYAGRNYPAGYGSLGGIKINYKTEVLDKNWQKIPGLYAAGIDTCDIFGDCYPFIFPGSTMGYAMNTGRMAGDNAAEYIKSL